MGAFAGDPTEFGHAESVELDAIHPHDLRKMVEVAITLHVDDHELRVIEEAEASEREILKAFAHRRQQRGSR